MSLSSSLISDNTSLKSDNISFLSSLIFKLLYSFVNLSIVSTKFLLVDIFSFIGSSSLCLSLIIIFCVFNNSIEYNLKSTANLGLFFILSIVKMGSSIFLKSKDVSLVGFLFLPLSPIALKKGSSNVTFLIVLSSHLSLISLIKNNNLLLALAS